MEDRPFTSSTSFKIPIASNAPINRARSRVMDITGINFFDEDLPHLDSKNDEDKEENVPAEIQWAKNFILTSFAFSR